MQWTAYDTWIIITASLCAIACSLPGNFLVLRQMSMMGDAVSHAVLPGIALGFLISGSRSSPLLFIGAAVAGLLTAVFTQWVSRFGNVDRGASMGIVFTTLFACGLLMIVRAANHVDLDASCVLYGELVMTPLDTLSLWGLEIPRAAAVLLGVSVANLVIVVAFFKELRIAAFDPELATTLGFNASLMHYLLMAMVAVTSVAAFEVAGSIIVIAMLIVPCATAHLLTDRLPAMIAISAGLAVLSAVCGHMGAVLLPRLWGFNATSSSGMIAVASGTLFFIACLISPKYGLLLKLLKIRLPQA